MALYIPDSIFHLAWLLYVRPETFRPYCVTYWLYNREECGYCTVRTEYLNMIVFSVGI